MKPSHLQTPRTLAECSFDTGYPCIERVARERFGIWLYLVGIMSALVGYALLVTP